MVGFRGVKQYMPQKPTKWGIKAFTMADSSNGYLLNVLVYTGAETLDGSPSPEDLPQPARVVMHLMQPCLNRGHHLFTDRYYTSIPLVQALQEQQTTFTGTCIRNRVGLPPNIRNPTRRLGDNEVLSYQSGKRAPQKKSAVIMLSSGPSLQMVTVHPQMPHRNEVTQPAVVDRYNHNMNGVDVADQLTVFYSIQRNTRKWWRKLFFWMLETTIVNSYIVYKSKVPSAATHLGYRRSIVNSLASDYIATAPPRPRIGRPRVTAQDPERLNGRLHILGKREQRQCVACSLPKRSIYFCKTCTSRPALCPSKCFELYHTQC